MIPVRPPNLDPQPARSWRQTLPGLLYPRLEPKFLPTMLAYSLAGACLAGAYGVVHDQITYSISPEYFTRLKFAQFHYADFGFPRRVFVAEIGFLATWWVGMIGGWFLARVVVPNRAPTQAYQAIRHGFAVMLFCGCVGSLAGFVLGLLLLGPQADYSGWVYFAQVYGIIDLQDFVRVAYIHNASYLGGLAGSVIALLKLRRPTR